jgi:putative NIF3 family GTP cyclohydrolase 1 type 2
MGLQFFGCYQQQFTDFQILGADIFALSAADTFGGGSCADYMQEALAAGCDTFVTADIKYNQFRTGYELGLNLIDAGHFHTENPTMPVLAENLRQVFPEVEVVLAENHSECMKFFV